MFKDMLFRTSLLLLLVPALAACVTTPRATPQTSVPNASTTVRAAPRTPPSAVPRTRPDPTVGMATGFRAPQVMTLAGITGLIGANADRLAQQFGQPRLDVIEGDARKLQFVGAACVLDIYLYPLTPGATPTATYVDARRGSDGLDVDRIACIKALLDR